MTISVSQKQLARKSASICIEQVGGWVGVAKLGSRWHRMIKVSEETLLPSEEAFAKMCLCEVRNAFCSAQYADCEKILLKTHNHRLKCLSLGL